MGASWIWIAASAAAAACGRIDFQQHVDASPSGDVAIDAASPCAGLTGATAFNASGTGTAASPYLICTTAQWADLAANPTSWGASFLLGADLDFSALTAPDPVIGTAATAFSGTFDGGHHIISNYTNHATAMYTGLFGNVSGGMIAHIAMQDVSISSDQFAGGLVGSLTGQLSDAAVFGTNCLITTTIFANHRGALVGELLSGAIKDVWASCKVDGDGSGVAGLVGHNQGSVSNCYFAYSGAVALNGNASGALVGNDVAPGALADCFVDADLTCTASSCGLVVGVATTPVTDIYYASNRSCTDSVAPCIVLGTGVDLTVTPDYFTLATNPPLAAWDFTTTWRARSGQPPTLAWLP
ncbi:MAG TPA: hypothetical protein VMJ10_15020 [Kofleriaceae bacterium]|nr:hypothetical protein [Kofleriaceae bacterium]